jgi:predicted RNA-binding Zn-ribbon protein involved in translation (DUF1610 family)
MVIQECLALKKNIANDKGAVTFDCPNCGNYKIIRSRKAREIVAKYICPSCGFSGPN